jgi:hypothetical protein
MAKLGVADSAPEFLQEMSDCSKHKQQFNMKAMQKVADHMNLKPCEGAQFSLLNSMALALTVNTHTTDGNQLLCSITSMQVESDLGRAQEGFHMLAVRLWEIVPDHAIFEEMAFTDEAMDKLASLGSQRSQKCMDFPRKLGITVFVFKSALMMYSSQFRWLLKTQVSPHQIVEALPPLPP